MDNINVFLDIVSLLLTYVWLPCTALALLVTSIITHDALLWYRMPPGPMPLPFVGNKYQLRKGVKPWIQFEAWSKTYGPIFTVWIGRRPTVVLSDPVIAQELLEKRSNKYSSRPRMVAMGEIYWDGASILVQPYGKAWSIRRKLLHQALTPKALQLYKPIQESEASRLCAQLLVPLDNRYRWEKLLERYSSSVVFSVAYGHRIDSLNAAVIRQRFQFLKYVSTLNVPGRYFVETFPVLKYVPNLLAPWKRDIQEHGKLEAAANIALVDVVQSDIERARAAGTLADLPQSLTRTLLEAREADPIPLSHRDFCFIPASLFNAGSDTTASTLCSAFLALVTHQDALRTAQAELDTVIGSKRSPTFSDEPNLPYMRALVKEVLRWRPVAVLGGTPHASTEDDYYNGWYIPRHTTVLGNSWAINLNEKYYPDPHVFEPARFLADGDADGDNNNNNNNDHDHDESTSFSRSTSRGVLDNQGQRQRARHPAKNGHSSFGWGRRVCPGADLAVDSLFIALAKIIWAFDIQPIESESLLSSSSEMAGGSGGDGGVVGKGAEMQSSEPESSSSSRSSGSRGVGKDRVGVDGTPKVRGSTHYRYDTLDYTDGFNIRPRAFPCLVRARSKSHEAVLRAEMDTAEKILVSFPPFGD